MKQYNHMRIDKYFRQENTNKTLAKIEDFAGLPKEKVPIDINHLNELGLAGWEICGVDTDYIYLKCEIGR